jgi:hypothetical protein
MDPDPGGPKTYGSDGSGSATLERTVMNKAKPKASYSQMEAADGNLLYVKAIMNGSVVLAGTVPPRPP